MSPETSSPLPVDRSRRSTADCASSNRTSRSATAVETLSAAAGGTAGAGTVLGIEGGGTRTSVLLVDSRDAILASFQTGPAVLPLMSDRELQWHLRAIAGRLQMVPDAICIGLAGVRTDVDCERLRRAASREWPAVPCLATNDLETALATTPVEGEVTRVLVLSGTGSCCFGRASDERAAKVGGRGHIIGDRGSACDIGLRALRLVMAHLDHYGSMGRLGAGTAARLARLPSRTHHPGIDFRPGGHADIKLSLYMP